MYRYVTCIRSYFTTQTTNLRCFSPFTLCTSVFIQLVQFISKFSCNLQRMRKYRSSVHLFYIRSFVGAVSGKVQTCFGWIIFQCTVNVTCYLTSLAWEIPWLLGKLLQTYFSSKAPFRSFPRMGWKTQQTKQKNSQRLQSFCTLPI